MPVTDSVQCVARIASKIGIAEKTKRYAIKVLKIAQDNEASAGKDPMGLAAAALYLSCVCLLYTSPSPRDPKTPRMPSYA